MAPMCCCARCSPLIEKQCKAFCIWVKSTGAIQLRRGGPHANVGCWRRPTFSGPAMHDGKVVGPTVHQAFHKWMNL